MKHAGDKIVAEVIYDQSVRVNLPSVSLCRVMSG